MKKYSKVENPLANTGNGTESEISTEIEKETETVKLLIGAARATQINVDWAQAQLDEHLVLVVKRLKPFCDGKERKCLNGSALSTMEIERALSEILQVKKY